MNHPIPGLRPIHNRTHDVAKVELRVAPFTTLEVDNDVAAQLLGTGDFREGVSPPAPVVAEQAGDVDDVDVAPVKKGRSRS